MSLTATAWSLPSTGMRVTDEHRSRRLVDRSVKTPAYKTLLTAEQTLELRALVEFAGWSRERIMARYSLSLDGAKRYIDYITRSRLVPKREHLPEDAR